MPPTIAAVTPTVCALLGIEPPRLSSEPPLPRITCATPIERCLIYAPDALGMHLWRRCPELAAEVEHHAPLRVELESVLPSVTPVCFASMFTGAPPARHGIQTYVKPQLLADTLFDALLRAGKRVAIVTVHHSSIDIIFRGRALDHFSEDYDPQVTQRTLELLERDEHDFILAYHQEYDDLLHKTEPFSERCIAAMRRHVAAFAQLAQAADKAWGGSSADQRAARRYALAFCPDHGAHLDPRTSHGTHGSNLPEDMELAHWWRVVGK